MLLYRLTKKAYAADLTGTGAKAHGGRWNNKGHAMLYCASNRSLAVLEVLVHLPPLLIPDGYVMVTISAPDDLETLTATRLPKNWKNSSGIVLKNIGDEFLLKNETLLLRVPSSIVDEDYNYLINPLHALAAQLKIVSIEPFGFDSRLL